MIVIVIIVFRFTVNHTFPRGERAKLSFGRIELSGECQRRPTRAAVELSHAEANPVGYKLRRTAMLLGTRAYRSHSIPATAPASHTLTRLDRGL